MAQFTGKLQGRFTLLDPNSCTVLVAIARQALADHFMSHLQPWLLDDVHSLLSETELAAFEERKYIGVHVRRGDKLHSPEGRKIESEARSVESKECSKR